MNKTLSAIIFSVINLSNDFFEASEINDILTLPVPFSSISMAYNN